MADLTYQPCHNQIVKDMSQHLPVCFNMQSERDKVFIFRIADFEDLNISGQILPPPHPGNFGHVAEIFFCTHNIFLIAQHFWPLSENF